MGFVADAGNSEPLTQRFPPFTSALRRIEKRRPCDTGHIHSMRYDLASQAGQVVPGDEPCSART